MTSPNLIAALPARKNRESNPFQYLLYAEWEKLGWRAEEFEDAIWQLPKVSLVHLHWPEGAIMQRSWARSFMRFCVFFLLLSLYKIKGCPIIWTAHNTKSHDHYHPKLESLMWWLLYGYLDAIITLKPKKQHPQLIKHPNLQGKPIQQIEHGEFASYYRERGAKSGEQRAEHILWESAKVAKCEGKSSHQKPEDRGQWSEDRGQRTENSGNGAPKLAASNQQPEPTQPPNLRTFPPSHLPTNLTTHNPQHTTSPQPHLRTFPPSHLPTKSPHSTTQPSVNLATACKATADHPPTTQEPNNQEPNNQEPPNQEPPNQEPSQPKIHLIFGQIRRYKNIPAALRKFQTHPNSFTKLIIAGRCWDEDLAEEIESIAAEDPRIEFRNAFIGEGEVAELFQTATALILTQEEEKNSGVQHLAASFGLPLIFPEQSMEPVMLPKPMGWAEIAREYCGVFLVLCA